jgi:hypothetical protein
MIPRTGEMTGKIREMTAQVGKGLRQCGIMVQDKKISVINKGE